MKALAARQSIQSILGVKVDGDIGQQTIAALNRLKGTPDDAEWPPVATQRPGVVLKGDGTWPWTAEIDGEDIVVRNARATCFGGSNDPQDSGETASGISTKGNPSLMACSLPMNYQGPHAPTKRALAGSPLPIVPWKTIVRVTSGGTSIDVPVIDLGPAKYTGNPIDLTIAAARQFNPTASATNFSMRCDFRILGGAKYVA